MSNSVHSGHRRRMEDKANEIGFENLPAHEQLEILLYSVIIRGNTNEIAHSLLEKYSSIYEIVMAPADELMEVKGIGRSTAEFLARMPKILGMVERGMFEKNIQFGTTQKLADYAKTFFYDKVVEAAYLFSLDAKKKLLKFNKLSEGIMNETYIYTEKVVELAVKNKAKYIVLAHNHPGGSLMPSPNDIMLSKELHKALKCVGISMTDSIIVSGRDYYSIAETGLFNDYI